MSQKLRTDKDRHNTRSRSEGEGEFVSGFPTPPSNRATSSDPHLRAIEMRTGLPREMWTHVAVPLATLKVCSLSVNTSLYPVTLL